MFGQFNISAILYDIFRIDFSVSIESHFFFLFIGMKHFETGGVLGDTSHDEIEEVDKHLGDLLDVEAVKRALPDDSVCTTLSL